ncbi:MAG: sulfatase [Verrucomicrobiales bacterium]|nr:sulfatase [Verrucomicrobiales bacterium]
MKSTRLSLLIRLLGLACLSSSTAVAAPPNVLLITADDLRPELGCYGSVALTPHLDALAARGTRFTRAYCQQAVCNPSRSSMLTGLRPGTLGLYVNGTHFRELKPDVTTLPLWFKEHGYTTRCAGKIFHNWHTKEKGDPRSWSAPEFLHFANHGDDAAQVSGPLPENHAKLSEGLRRYGSVGMTEAYDVPDEAYYDGRVAAEAVRLLPELKKGGPFFLAVGFWKPHAPFNAPKKYWDLYDRATLPPVDPRWPTNAPEIASHPSGEILGSGKDRRTPTDGQVAEMRHGYLAAVSYLDAQVGKVLTALRDEGLADNTIVVFWGDHGYHLGEHGLWAKTSNFELDARVPLIVATPAPAHPGAESASLVEMIDLFPTLVELAGLPAAPGLEGASLVPVLKDPTASVKPAAFTQHPRPPYPDRSPRKAPELMGYSVRTADWRYTEWRNWDTGAIEATELYDHRKEQPELENLAAAPPDPIGFEAARRLLHAQFPPQASKAP